MSNKTLRNKFTDKDITTAKFLAKLPELITRAT